MKNSRTHRRNIFVDKLCKEFALTRESTDPETQAYYDRVLLGYRIWPYFYFNYTYPEAFDRTIEGMYGSANPVEFISILLELFQLQYIAALMSLDVNKVKNDELYRSHFYDMQRGMRALIQATGSTPREIIDNTLSEMLYYDITYTWSTRPMFGPYTSHYSAKALLHAIKERL